MRTLVGLVLMIAASAAVWGDATSKEDRLAVLKFGIESEVLDLVRSLQQEKNSDYREALAAAYTTAHNDDLKQALLYLFQDQKDNGLEDAAVKELGDPDKKANSLLLNAISYLTELKSAKAKDNLVTLVTGKNKVVALAAIRALGRLGATDKVDDLIKLYKDAETDPNFKPDLIWSFGEMKATGAVDLLLSEYDDNESQPLLRRSILEALGKIGDDKGWDRVMQALGDTNTDLRSAAVATLGSYPTHDTEALLTNALRDSAPAVRQAAAKGAAAAKNPNLKDLVAYRVKKDPDPKVQVEALRALAAYDDGPAAVLAFLADKKTAPVIWRESLTIALDKKYPGTFDALKKVIEDDGKDKLGQLSSVIVGAILPQRETFRGLYGLLLASTQIPARSGALRAITLGKFTEFESVLRTLEAKDPDPGVKAQAKQTLQALGLEASDDPKAKK
jgi:HEAT repeat protein